jgi:hypothetical protein
MTGQTIEVTYVTFLPSGYSMSFRCHYMAKLPFILLTPTSWRWRVQ